MTRTLPTVLAASLTLAACDDDASRLTEAIEQYCVTVNECDDSRYCEFAIDCDEAGNCSLALECGGEPGRERCAADHEQLIEEAHSEQCVPLWTSFLRCESALSCIDFDTSTGYQICSDELTEEFADRPVGRLWRFENRARRFDFG